MAVQNRWNASSSSRHGRWVLPW